jgi:RHS repeat-associated protein
VTDYTWDHRNRLVRVSIRPTDNGPLTTDIAYTYDVFDRRVAKQVDLDGSGPQTPQKEYYIYDGQHIALSFVDPDGPGAQAPALKHRYLHGAVVDQILADEVVSSTTTPGNVLWPLADNLDTVRDIVDFNEMTNVAQMVNHLTYDSFGRITAETNAAMDFLFAFTGRERDEETGLYYYRARYYDPATGRFLSRDPIEFEALDPNLYRYVDNGPTNWKDPSGLWGEDVHRDLTAWWAQYLIGYPETAAIAIGAADEGCDHGKTGPLPKQDQSYHFDRGGTMPTKWRQLFNALVTQMGLQGTRQTDSRFRHFFENLSQALNAIRPSVDDPRKATYHLGMALHPLQDWVAHGDHGWTNPGSIGEPHNSRSPQKDDWYLVDNRRLDASGACDGRPAGRALRVVVVNGGMAVRDFALYEPGHKRLDLTRELTTGVLEYFLNAVRANGGRKSKAYFLRA